MEPPPVKAPKPLPKPDDAPRKKRGGRRYINYIYIQYNVVALSFDKSRIVGFSVRLKVQCFSDKHAHRYTLNAVQLCIMKV